MKKIFQLKALSLLLLVLLFNCSPKYYMAKNFTELSFGHGGGFTGAVTEYTITASGKVHKTEGLQPEQIIAGQLEPKTLQQLDQKLNSLNLTDYSYSKPGNYSHFIKLRQNSQVHQITWADGNEEEVRQDVIEFYQWLTAQIQQLEQNR